MGNVSDVHSILVLRVTRKMGARVISGIFESLQNARSCRGMAHAAVGFRPSAAV